MGWFSSLKNKIKKALKKVAHVVKGIVRAVVRVVVTLVGAVLGIFDLLLGFIAWPPKKMRVHIFILSTEKGPLIDPASLTASVDFLRKTYKDKYNVKVKAYSESMIEIIKEPAPSAALNVDCGGGAFIHEFGEAGDYFAKHLAGWNAIPISLTFPVTVFIVNNVSGTGGCSLGPLTDYVTCDISTDGVGAPSLIAHEIGHACSLWHSGTKSNLMYHPSDRGNGAKWFQKHLVRSSRHVTYW
jgi:hypothetical protein